MWQANFALHTNCCDAAGGCRNRPHSRGFSTRVRAINSAPQQPGVIIVTALMVFLAGISLGSLLAAGPTSVVATDVAPAMLYPGGTQLTMR